MDRNISSHPVYIGMGSNMGARLEFLRSARLGLEQRGVRIIASSPVYCTEPVGGPQGQEDYYNAVLGAQVTCSAVELLHICREVEQNAGRKRLQRWGPRTLDLDILLYADSIISTSILQIPHPRMHERRFVLEPLAAIAPHLILPGQEKTVAEFLLLLPETPRVCKVADTW